MVVCNWCVSVFRDVDTGGCGCVSVRVGRHVLGRLPAQVEGAELDEHALPRRGQERVQTLAAVVVRVHQLRGMEGAVARAATTHERAVALCGYKKKHVHDSSNMATLNANCYLTCKWKIVT